MDLPIYTLIDGDLSYISLVESPAVEVDFLCFNKSEKPFPLKFNDGKRMVTGIAMLADTPIYRYNPQIGEHYVTFTPQLIESLAFKFFAHHKQQEVNIEHNDVVNDLTIVESYFINHERGIVPSEFATVPNGSWVVTYKVDNEEVYKAIKNGEVKGFSIEGTFTYPDEAFQKKDTESIADNDLEAFIDSLLG